MAQAKHDVNLCGVKNDDASAVCSAFDAFNAFGVNQGAPLLVAFPYAGVGRAPVHNKPNLARAPGGTGMAGGPELM